MDIVYYPHPVLRRKAEPIDEITDEVRQKVAEMFDLMRLQKGVGLAAPQGGWGRRVIVYNPSERPEDDRVLVNLRLLGGRGAASGEEGCLSLPGIYVEVKRMEEVEVEAMSLEGETLRFVATGFEARILQHEHDHLEGILLVDRMSPADRIRHKKKIRELEKRYRRVHETTRP